MISVFIYWWDDDVGRDNDLMLCDLLEHMGRFWSRRDLCSIDHEWFDMIGVLYPLCCPLDSDTIEMMGVRFFAFATIRRHIIDSLADRTEPIEYVIVCLMIADTDATLFALWDVSAGLTDESGSESFFVNDEKDFFILLDILGYSGLYDLTKISFLLCHVDEIEFFGW